MVVATSAACQMSTGRNLFKAKGQVWDAKWHATRNILKLRPLFRRVLAKTKGR